MFIHSHLLSLLAFWPMFLFWACLPWIAPADPCKMKITFGGYARSETLTNFPALVVFGTNTMADNFDYSQFASPNGWDLRFSNAVQTAGLNYEIARWTTNGNSSVWVQVPLLARNASIWAYWGNTNLACAPAACITDGSTWSNGFVGVWHMHQTNARDSTAFQNHGSSSGAVSSAEGFVDGADRFVPNSRGVHVPYSGSLDLTNAGTVEAWVYVNGCTNEDATNAGLVHKGDSGDVVNHNAFVDETYSLQLWQGNAFLFALQGGDGWLQTDVVVTGQWYHVVGSWDLSTMWMCLNGTMQAPYAYAGGTFTSTGGLNLGCQVMSPSYWNSLYNCLDGMLDEVRVSAVTRSPNWLWATWMNIASNDAFATYGPVTAPGEMGTVILFLR